MKTILKSAIFALALAVTVSASAEGYMFNTNLKFGARGADVTALQDRLKAEGVYTYGVSTGYFGMVTKKAVQDYQFAKNITPRSGFVGPLTRAMLNASSPVVVVPGTTTVVNNTLSGGEGFAEVKISPLVTNNPNVQTNTDVNVYALEFKAKQADISVERINLGVSVDANPSGTASFENPSTLINRIMIKDGSTVLATIPVNSSTFSKDTSVTPNLYYVQIAGLGLKVSKDTLKTLTVSFDTNSIDTERKVTINVYGTQGIRVVDGRGISNYSTLTDVRTHTFKKPGTSSLSARDDATTIYSVNYRINRNSNGAEKVLTSTFALKSDTGSSKITNVSVRATVLTSTSTLPSNIYLYDGSTLIDARSTASPVGSTTADVVFDLSSYNVSVGTDMLKTFTIKVDMPSNTATGTVVSTKVQSVTYEKPNGSSETLSTLTIPATPVFHYFAPVVPQFSKVSSMLTTIKNGASNAVTGIEGKVVLGVSPQGGNINANMTAVLRLQNTASTTLFATTSVTASVEGGVTTLAEGSVRNLEFTGTFASTTPTGVYKLKVDSITWTPTGGSAVTQSAGFEALDSSTFSY